MRRGLVRRPQAGRHHRARTLQAEAAAQVRYVHSIGADGDNNTAAAPRYACPDLIAREGYWARPVKESLARPGARLSFCLCPGDLGSLDLRLFVNNQHAGRHLTGLPALAAAGGCWAVLDVYGSTVGLASIREEAVPVQVSWWPPPDCW